MMELDVFPEELRKQAVEIGQVLKMDMYPSDRVRPKTVFNNAEQILNHNQYFMQFKTPDQVGGDATSFSLTK